MLLHLIAAAAVLAAGTEKPIFIINEDNSHFFGSRDAKDMTLEGLNAFVDQYAGTYVTHLFLNPNAMRASYPSKVRDVIWDVGKQKVPADIPFAQKWVDNARLLNERGLDPYAVWVARCREKNISPWITMRMNDVHDVNDTTNYMHSTFWLNHPEYWRVPYESRGSWTDRALDYAKPEVREFNMRLLRELMERYDADGFELDWMRFGYHFAHGHERAGAEILTQFMRDARALANEWTAKRGHPIQISARVPADPDAAVGLGMDGVRWAKEGLIDLLVPTPFWASADFDIPVEVWKARIGNATAKVKIAPGTEVLVGAYPGAKQVLNDLASVYGFVNGAWSRGADAIYTFNYMDPAPILGGTQAYRTLLEKGVSRDLVATQTCRYPVTYRDTVPAGVSNNAQLPFSTEGAHEVRIQAGALPAKYTATIAIGLAADVSPALTVQCNGKACGKAATEAPQERMPGAARIERYNCPDNSIVTGRNTISITAANGDQKTNVAWLELEVAPAQ